MPYDDNYFDAITCSFGVRNFSDLTSGLKDMFRVLKLGGKLYILEFSIPQNKFIRFLYLPYLKFYIPLLGKFITGSFSAYKYLTRTVQFFPCGVEFCRILENAGFTDVKAQPLTFGIVTLYSARR